MSQQVMLAFILGPSQHVILVEKMWDLGICISKNSKQISRFLDKEYFGI
jgi:hypothetical protein